MNLAIYGAHLLNMMRSWDRHSSKTISVDDKAQLIDYEHLVIDLVDPVIIDAIGESVKKKLFGENQRPIKYTVNTFDNFSIVTLPLRHAYNGKDDDGFSNYTNAVDQIAFASFFILEVKNNIKNISDCHKLGSKED